MVVIQDDVTDLEVNLMELQGDVNFLFDEHVIQDERLLGLEQGIDVIESDLVAIDEELQGTFLINFYYFKGSMTFLTLETTSVGLQATTITLDFRVTALEENGEDDGNSSVAELEVRVETLEEATADHQTRISTTEMDVSGGLMRE